VGEKKNLIECIRKPVFLGVYLSSLPLEVNRAKKREVR
jgi:hypothetical protein